MKPTYTEQQFDTLLREKLFGEGPRLAPGHPGAGYRNLGELNRSRATEPA